MRVIDVECGRTGCPEQGRVRRVQLRLAALGVVELPRLVCARCGREMRQVGGWLRDDEQEADVPKITVHGGPTNAALDQAEPAEVVGDGTGEALPPLDEGGERSSHGGSSSTSPARPSSTGKKSATAPRKPARTAGSR